MNSSQILQQSAALYIHMPWCIKKCPYCDFNSHQSPTSLPEIEYIHALIDDLKQDLTFFKPRAISSIFIGGGTPSLLSEKAYALLFDALYALLPIASEAEITLEANPGTVEQERFKAYRAIGINRLSLGIQSFNAKHLKILGRIHNDEEAHKAILTAREAGFDNINLDIMHGLPQQTSSEGLNDLKVALSYNPEHLSWYQLTLEPNTVFYKTQPKLPDEDTCDSLEQKGFHLLKEQGLIRYEISAFSKAQKEAKHNLNYWLFGDYFGIGAGAHGKITEEGVVYRTRKQKQPKLYLDSSKCVLAERVIVDPEALLFEFMINTTRLQQPIPNTLFTNKTGIPFDKLKPKLDEAALKGLLILQEDFWQVSELGRRYTNDLQAMFLP